MTNKCKVPGCENRKSEGGFHGNLCTPCWLYLRGTSSGYTPSQAEANATRRELFYGTGLICGSVNFIKEDEDTGELSGGFEDTSIW